MARVSPTIGEAEELANYEVLLSKITSLDRSSDEFSTTVEKKP